VTRFRRLRRVGLVLVILLVIARLSLPWVLPPVLSSYAEDVGFSLTWERLELSPLLLDLELAHVEIEPLDGVGPSAHLEYARVDLALTPLVLGKVRVRRVELDGVDLTLERAEDGSLVLPAVLTADTDVPVEADEPEPEDLEPKPLLLKPPVRVDAARVQGLQLAFVDGSVDPPLSTRVDVDLRLSDLGVPGRLPRCELNLAARGVLDRLQLELTGPVEDERAEADLWLRVGGLHLEPLAPYLSDLGVEALGRTLFLDLGGQVEVRGGDTKALRVDLDQVLARVDGENLLRLGPLRFQGRQDEPGVLDVDRLDLTGLRAGFTLLPGGGLELPGLRLLPAAPSEAQDEEPGDSGPPTRVRVASMTLTDHRLELVDAVHDPPTAVPILVERLKLTDVDTDLTATGEPARLDALLHGPGLVESLGVTGTLDRLPTGGQVDLELSATGLSPVGGSGLLTRLGLPPGFAGQDLAMGLEGEWSHEVDRHSGKFLMERVRLGPRQSPLVAMRNLSVTGVLDLSGTGRQGELALDIEGLTGSALGVSGVSLPLQDGALSLAASFREQATSEAPVLWAEVGPLVLSDGDQDLLAVDKLTLEEARLQDVAPRVTAVALDGLRFAASSDEAGTLLAGVLLSAPTPDDEATSAPGAEDVTEPPSSGAEAGGGATPLRIDSVRLSGITIELDESLSRLPLQAPVQLSLEADDLVIGGDDPTPLRIAASVDDGPQLSLQGSLGLAPDRPSVELTLRGRSLDFALLTELLPRGMESTLEDGALDARLSLLASPAPEGGRDLFVTVEGLNLRDMARATDRSLLQWQALRLDVPRLDPLAGVYDVEELSLTGLAMSAGRDEEGRLHLPGLVMTPVRPRAGPPLPPLPPPPGTSGGADHADVPDLRLGRIHITAPTLTWDEAGQSLELTDLELITDGVLVLTDQTEDDRLGLTVSGGLAPLVDHVSLQASVAPFAVEPTLGLELALEGVHGPAWHELLPGLDETLDMRELADGHMEARLDTTWLGRRRGPLHFDTAAGVPFDVRLSGVALREGARGELLLALGSLDLDVASALGSDGLTHLETVEVVGPRIHVVRVPGGLEVAHVLLRDPPPVDPDAPDDRPALADGFVADEAAARERALQELMLGYLVVAPLPMASGDPLFMGPPAPGVGFVGSGGMGAAPITGPDALPRPSYGVPVQSRLQVDRLLMAGADLLYADMTTEPPLVIPVTGLDVEARGLSSSLLEESTQTMIDAIVTGGPPPAAFEELAGPAFDEVAVAAQLEFYPRMKGRLHVGLTGVELPALAGPAAESGVTIRDGTLDGQANLHFEDDGGLDVDSRFVFTDLDMDEPADGPIASALLLPSPLGSVIFVLRDETGAITIPLDFSLEPDGMSLMEANRVAIAGLGRLIGQAIANTPFRVVGGLADTVGGFMGFGSIWGEVEPAGDPVRLEFAASALQLTTGAREELELLARRIEDEDDLRLTLRHEPGLDDVERLTGRANPEPSHISELAGRLRVRKANLDWRRDAEAERLTAALAAGLYERAAPMTERLASMEHETGLLERAIDELLEVLRPGNETLAGRRTRVMTSAVAQLRLSIVAEALRDRLDDDDEARVRIISARPGDQAEQSVGGVLVTPARIK
jgi:hypothetical protein